MSAEGFFLFSISIYISNNEDLDLNQTQWVFIL